MSQESYRKEVQTEQRDGVTIAIHRYVEKRIVTRGIPSADGTSVQYVAQATDVFQVQVKLTDGAGILLEPGALQYSFGKITADVVQHEAGKGLLGRMVSSAGTGESAYATRMKGTGVIWCEPSRKHFIVTTMDSEEDAMLIDDKAFYCCSTGIKLTTHRHASIAGALSGNGLMQPKLSGAGVFVIESPVPVEEIEIVEVQEGQELVVDGDFMLMYSASLTVEIGTLVKGLRNALRSGEGFVYRLKGRGTAFIMPSARIA